ncbi:NUDIX hydrolase [Billgrantia sp. LNSP4103-1]|uniref:NUDIX hydrolase n=1 Tax=Billgrantia sp. LNSP4103-1 TaxID=3410266 RepID=UPI00403F4C72
MPNHVDSPVIPTPAAAAALVHRGRLLTVRRRYPPNAGLLALPGGKVEAGEPLLEAAVRELHEETGVLAEAERVLTALDQFQHDDAGLLLHHFVIVVVLCRWVGGDAVAGDDASAIHWLPAEQAWDEPGLCASTRRVAIDLLENPSLR